MLDLIESQLVANRLPIVAVTLAAVPHINTPVVLTIHWHGFEAQRITETSDADELMETAGHSGYEQWLYRPVRGGLWSALANDITLESGGYRNSTCPLSGKPLVEAKRLRKTRKEVFPLGTTVTLID